MVLHLEGDSTIMRNWGSLLLLLKDIICRWRKTLILLKALYFMVPHVCSVSVRNEGMSLLMSVYSGMVMRKENLVNEENEIDVRMLKKWLSELSKKEEELLIVEMEKRERMEVSLRNRPRMKDEKKERERELEDMPMYHREVEKYINPKEKGWESRYRKVLYKGSVVEMVESYLSSVNWVWHYYRNGCENWRCKYEYIHAPLLCDIVSYLRNVSKLPNPHERRLCPFEAETQLAYVVPPLLLRECVGHEGKWNEMEKRYSEYFAKLMNPSEWKMDWVYSRYLWESKMILPVGNQGFPYDPSV